MKKVKYDKLVKELFEAVLSSDAEEDKYCKKLVANVNFGLLEKGQNKVQKSKIFNTLVEVRYHQETYGGKVSILKKFQEEVVEQQCDLECLEQSTFTKGYFNKIEVVNRKYPELNLARPQIYWVATETVIYDFCDLDFVDKILETTKNIPSRRSIL